MISVILAGGQGNRLWPKSRRNFPKQFCTLVGEQSMLDATINRLINIGSTKIIIITNDVILEATKTLVRKRHDSEIIEILSEPEGRNTAPAVGLILSALYAQNSNEIIGVFPADHYIPETPAFSQCIASALATAGMGLLVTIGIAPTQPETGYGYIEKDLRQDTILPHVYKIRSFCEKPDDATAQAYIDSGNYLWNSGIYIGQVKTLLNEYALHLPAVFTEILKGYDSYLHAYDNLPNISLDKAISEKSSVMAVVESNFRWHDLGSWESFKDLFASDAEGNCCIGNDILTLESKECLIGQENKTVVLYDVENLLVIETKEIVFVTRQKKGQDIRKVVKMLEENGRSDLL
ncbi:MAG: NTP transferase domain-containing protein [Acholeplasmataceae bacterium]|nr:NTP transferase domain-containing protein [Acholeplasmataceae bacterium]